jgi:hypothetical protein
MSVEVKRRTYPWIPAKVWWELRRRFQRTVPGQVTTSYLETVLGIQEGHAKNLVPQLRAVSLIDDDGKPTPLANGWRTDDGYADACQRIFDISYPAELKDAVPQSHLDRGAAQRWFMRELGVGEAAASRMASFYILLAEKDPKGEDLPKESQGPKATKRAQIVAKPSAKVRVKAERDSRNGSHGPDTKDVDPQMQFGPTIHIDVQVHLPSDANPEQIDAIFASMAKHLYRR